MAKVSGDELRNLIPADMEMLGPEEEEQGELVDYEEDNDDQGAPANQEGEREQKQGDSSDKDRKPISWQAWKGPAEDEPPKNARADGKTELRSRRKEDEKGRSKDDRKDRAEARSKRHEKPDDEKRGLDERPKSRGKPATQRIEDGRGEPRRPRRIVERKPDRRSPPRSYYREPRHSTYRRSRSRSPYSRLPPPRDHHRSPRRRTPPPSRWQASRSPSRHTHYHRPASDYHPPHSYHSYREPSLPSHHADKIDYLQRPDNREPTFRPHSPSAYSRLEQGYSRRPADDPYFRPPRDSVHALTELERLNQLERMRQMELDLIQREKRELEMGLVPGPYFPRSPMDPLSPPYRPEDLRAQPWAFETSLPLGPVTHSFQGLALSPTEALDLDHRAPSYPQQRQEMGSRPSDEPGELDAAPPRKKARVADAPDSKHRGSADKPRPPRNAAVVLASERRATSAEEGTRSVDKRAVVLAAEREAPAPRGKDRPADKKAILKSTDRKGSSASKEPASATRKVAVLDSGRAAKQGEQKAGSAKARDSDKTVEAERKHNQGKPLFIAPLVHHELAISEWKDERELDGMPVTGSWLQALQNTNILEPANHRELVAGDKRSSKSSADKQLQSPRPAPSSSQKSQPKDAKGLKDPAGRGTATKPQPSSSRLDGANGPTAAKRSSKPAQQESSSVAPKVAASVAQKEGAKPSRKAAERSQSTATDSKAGPGESSRSVQRKDTSRTAAGKGASSKASPKDTQRAAPEKSDAKATTLHPGSSYGRHKAKEAVTPVQSGKPSPKAAHKSEIDKPPARAGSRADEKRTTSGQEKPAGKARPADTGRGSSRTSKPDAHAADRSEHPKAGLPFVHQSSGNAAEKSTAGKPGGVTGRTRLRRTTSRDDHKPDATRPLHRPPTGPAHRKPAELPRPGGSESAMHTTERSGFQGEIMPEAGRSRDLYTRRESSFDGETGLPLPPLDLQHHNMMPAMDAPLPRLPGLPMPGFTAGFMDAPPTGRMLDPILPLPELPRLHHNPYADSHQLGGPGFHVDRGISLAMPFPDLQDNPSRFAPADGLEFKGRGLAADRPGVNFPDRGQYQERGKQQGPLRHAEMHSFLSDSSLRGGGPQQRMPLPGPPATSHDPTYKVKASIPDTASNLPPRLRSGVMIGSPAPNMPLGMNSRSSSHVTSYARSQQAPEANRRPPSLRLSREDEQRNQWYYMDPQGIVQGPASKAQLRIWLTQLSLAPDKSRYQAFCRVHVWREGMRQSESVELLRLLNDNLRP